MKYSVGQRVIVKYSVSRLRQDPGTVVELSDTPNHLYPYVVELDIHKNRPKSITYPNAKSYYGENQLTLITEPNDILKELLK